MAIKANTSGMSFLLVLSLSLLCNNSLSMMNKKDFIESNKINNKIKKTDGITIKNNPKFILHQREIVLITNMKDQMPKEEAKIITNKGVSILQGEITEIKPLQKEGKNYDQNLEIAIEQAKKKAKRQRQKDKAESARQQIEDKKIVSIENPILLNTPLNKKERQAKLEKQIAETKARKIINIIHEEAKNQKNTFIQTVGIASNIDGAILSIDRIKNMEESELNKEFIAWKKNYLEHTDYMEKYKDEQLIHRACENLLKSGALTTFRINAAKNTVAFKRTIRSLLKCTGENNTITEKRSAFQKIVTLSAKLQFKNRVIDEQIIKKSQEKSIHKLEGNFIQTANIEKQNIDLSSMISQKACDFLPGADIQDGLLRLPIEHRANFLKFLHENKTISNTLYKRLLKSELIQKH
jgi:hypothetical protein